jgi:hypothetical protein
MVAEREVELPDFFPIERDLCDRGSANSIHRLPVLGRAIERVLTIVDKRSVEMTLGLMVGGCR